MSIYAQQVSDLPECDDKSGSGDEPGDHRMRQEIGKETETQEAHQQQHQARQRGKGNSRAHIFRGTDFRDLRHRHGGHQRHHGHGAH